MSKPSTSNYRALRYWPYILLHMFLWLKLGQHGIVADWSWWWVTLPVSSLVVIALAQWVFEAIVTRRTNAAFARTIREECGADG